MPLPSTIYEYCRVRIIHEVNCCEAQYVDGSVFTFRSIEEVLEWLNETDHKVAVPIAAGALIFSDCFVIFWSAVSCE